MKVGRLLACLALVLSASCKDDPVTPGTGNSDNVMTATVDGLSVAPTSVTAVKASGRVHIVGTGAFRTITLSLAVPTGPGEVHLLLDDPVNTALIAEGTPPNNPVWSTALVPRDTTTAQFSIINFTSVSSTGLAGAFYLKGGPASGGALGVRYANGTFSVKF